MHIQYYIIPTPKRFIRKPLISITRNPVLGTTIVFRAPISRAWICNITIAAQLPRMDWGLTMLSGAAILAGSAMGLIMAASAFMALKTWGGF